MKYSSNLKFSLAPGWAFVETEVWRKDLGCKWLGYGGEVGQFSFFSSFRNALDILNYVFLIDGWVYINDAWLEPRPVPYNLEEELLQGTRRG